MPSPEVASVVSAPAYVRERIAPAPGDPLYVHLADLLAALKVVATPAAIDVLDFGCGGSPYRSLFPNARYRRADLPGGDQLDYVVDDSGRLHANDASFDLILSAQVLEHCLDPAVYLAEAFRLLRVGGRLVCTTHGLFEDHACPSDYQRWTADGLRRDLERAGFSVLRVLKVTVGPRALLHFMDRLAPVAHVPRYSVFWLLMGLLRRVLVRFRSAIHRAADRAWPQHAVVDATQPDAETYVALLAVAERP